MNHGFISVYGYGSEWTFKINLMAGYVYML